MLNETKQRTHVNEVSNASSIHHDVSWQREMRLNELNLCRQQTEFEGGVQYRSTSLPRIEFKREECAKLAGILESNTAKCIVEV